MEEARVKTWVEVSTQHLACYIDHPLTDAEIVAVAAADWHVVSVFVAAEPSHVEAAL